MLIGHVELGAKTTLYIITPKAMETVIVPTKTFKDFVIENDIPEDFPYPNIEVDTDKKTITLIEGENVE